MDNFYAILEDVNPEVDWKGETGLIDNGILTSFDILAIVAELQETYDVDITPVDIIPDNFNSAEAIYAMVERLREE